MDYCIINMSFGQSQYDQSQQYGTPYNHPFNNTTHTHSGFSANSDGTNAYYIDNDGYYNLDNNGRKTYFDPNQNDIYHNGTNIRNQYKNNGNRSNGWGFSSLFTSNQNQGYNNNKPTNYLGFGGRRRKRKTLTKHYGGKKSRKSRRRRTRRM